MSILTIFENQLIKTKNSAKLFYWRVESQHLKVKNGHETPLKQMNKKMK